MATAVDNVSIASAKERAASILYGNEKSIEPVINEYKPVTPVIAEYSVPVKEESKPKPTFSGYYNIETAQAKRPTQFRSYETPSELDYVNNPQVVRPFIEATKSTDNVTGNLASYNAAPVAVTSTKIKSEIDVELEENTQYVVRFKAPTIIAAAALAVIFFLMAVLFVVNIVSLTSSASALSRLEKEQESIQQQLEQSIKDSTTAKNEALADINGNLADYEDVTVKVIAGDSVEFYQPSSSGSGNASFFDWLCKALSSLFS